ncbi:MAG: flagellar hook-length control protein FliK [Lachnospiraceae bacterium]|nr:flagellar hook-length control protein FliK [Lachnospiraceae bacterium]
MTAISNITETLASVDVSNAIGKNSVGTEEKITTSFMNFMSGYDSHTNNNSIADNKAVASKDDSTKSFDNKSFEETKTFSSVNNDKVSQNTSSKPNEISDEDKKAFATFEEDVKQVIKEKLDVTDEEIEEVMAELGLSIVDLMNPQNVTELVMTLSDVEDVSELLTIDGFGELKTAIMDLTAELNNQLDIEPDAVTQFANVIENSTSKTVDEPITLDGPENLNVRPETMTVNDEATATKTTVEAETNSEVQASTTVQAAAENVETPKAETNVKADDIAETLAEVNVNVKDEANVEVKNTNETETEEQVSVENKVNAAITETSEENDNTSDSKEESERQSSFDRRPESAITRNAREPHNTGNDVTFNIEGRLNAENTVSRTENVTPAYVDTENIISQIVTQARVINTQNVSTIVMQLNPENLGKMILHVAQEDGHITAKITAQNEVVKEALQTQLADLRVNLNQQGIKVDAVEITVSSHAFEENLEGQFTNDNGEESSNDSNATARRTLNVNDIDDDNLDLAEEEQLAVNIMRDNGNQLDMHA